MSTDAKPSTPEHYPAALFAEGELPIPAARDESPLKPAAVPRLMTPQRHQIELRAMDLDSLLAADHPARTVWAFVQALDVAPLYARIKAVEGTAGRPTIDPAILVALWLWATVDGVGSAREVDRLCERDNAYRWLCGGVGLNHHTLADFRTQHAGWLDAQLTRSIASLLERKLVTLNVVSQDGLRVRAWAKAASFRREHRLQALLEQAREQVQALKSELDGDASASTRRKQAAVQRAAREREQRLTQALATMSKIERKQPTKKSDDKDPPNGTPAAKAPAEPRVSTTDPDARVMKMADGGFRPAFNAQLAVDTHTQLIAAVEVVNIGSDMQQMAPMHASVLERYAVTPKHWLADGGFAKFTAIEQLATHGTQALVPPPNSRKPGIDPFEPKSTDSPTVAQWRARMATPEAQALYKQRAATVECVNAQVRRRGLQQFNVRGLLKARAVLLWHALAHNLMRMASLNIALQT
jgi:transposase